MKEIDVAFEIMTLAHMVHRTHNNMIPTEYRSKVTGTNMHIIHYLHVNEEKDVFQRDLECYFQVRPSTISANLRLMEKNGLVMRENVAHDARLKKIVLSKESLILIENTKNIRKEIKEKFTNAITPEEAKTLYELIHKLRNTLDDTLLD